MVTHTLIDIAAQCRFKCNDCQVANGLAVANGGAKQVCNSRNISHFWRPNYYLYLLYY